MLSGGLSRIPSRSVRSTGRLSVREGVKSCSEHHVLAHAVTKRFRETVFGKPTAHDESCHQPRPGGTGHTFQEFDTRLVDVALQIDDAGAYRVIEDFRLGVERLAAQEEPSMNRAAYRKSTPSAVTSYSESLNVAT